MKLTTVSLGDYLLLGGYFSVVILTSQCTSLVVHTSFAKLEEVKNLIQIHVELQVLHSAGWVIDHNWNIFKDVCLIVRNVNQSYSAFQLHLWVTIRNNGETCSHGGALLYCMDGISCRWGK